MSGFHLLIVNARFSIQTQSQKEHELKITTWSDKLLSLLQKEVRNNKSNFTGKTDYP